MTERQSGVDYTDMVNGLPDGWVKAMGLHFLTASPEELTAQVAVGPQHLQPYGIVHGGVYAGIVESMASIGAALNVMPDGKSAVGLENHTSFVRACRGGTLRARATPITRGSRSQVWDVIISNDRDQVVATGRVRMLVLDKDSAVAGGDLTIKG